MTSIITEKTVQNIIGKRKREIHKGDCGRIMIAAGSLGMAGAAILAARSALRAGSGLVRTAIPLSLFPIVQVGVPEATCIERHLPMQGLADYDAICVGPGLGEEKDAIDFVKELLVSYEKTLIVDADGLNIIAHNDLFELLRARAERCPERLVLTPHMGEAARLLAAAGTPLATRPCAARPAPAAPSAPQQPAAPAAPSAPQKPDALTDLPASQQAETHAAAGTPLATRPCAARPAPAAPSGSQQPAAPAAPSTSKQSDALTALPASQQSDTPPADAFDFSSTASAEDREKIADALVQKTGAIIILKGAGTLVAAPGRKTYTNTTGNPGMATAGSGDVLSGIITSLAGQRRQTDVLFAPDFEPEMKAPGGLTAPGYNQEMQVAQNTPAAGKAPQAEEKAPQPGRIGAFAAAIAGVYIHGLAADLAAAELGEYGLTAGDIAHYTAYAIKKILSED